MGPPKTDDPSHIRLEVMVWALAQQVFHLLDPWPTKEGNTFINKNHTLVKDYKKDFEDDLQPNQFLKKF